MFDVLLDGLDEFGNAPEHSSTDSLFGQVSEPSFHKVKPGTTGGDEVHVEARMTRDPSLYLRMFVGRVVVDDQVQGEIGIGAFIDGVEEVDPLLMAMSLQAFTDHDSLGDIEGGEEGGCAVTLVVMSQSPDAPVIHRQAGLGTVQSLNLALFSNSVGQAAPGNLCL